MFDEHDIIVLSETWLNDGIHTSELFDNRYVVYRGDRNLQLQFTTYKIKNYF